MKMIVCNLLKVAMFRLQFTYLTLLYLSQHTSLNKLEMILLQNLDLSENIGKAVIK